MAGTGKTSAERVHGGWRDWIEDRVLRALIWLLLRLPVKQRLAGVSWIIRKLIAPLTGWRDRALANLAYVWPDMPDQEKRVIADRAIDNFARAIIENYDPADLLRRGGESTLSGPGVAVIEKARADGTPVLLVSGHFGSAEAARCALIGRGYQIGGLYRPLSNPFFNAHYSRNMHTICEPVFPQGRRGTMGLIKHIKSGGFAVLLFDLYDSAGIPIDFLGRPAPTLTSAADIALRTGALMVPYFGLRHADGLSFSAFVESPIDHGDPVEMMREATRRLEARITETPGQWLWIHRRWKPKRQAKLQKKRQEAGQT